MTTVAAVIILGWLLASIIETWAYFAGKPNEESKFPLPNFLSKQ